MCNIAGYVGTKQAAPIVLDMLRRQEGFDGGHYTGLATIDDGKLYFKKDVGSIDYVFADYDISQLPGTVGFIHSRTPGGVGQENGHWAHPFISNDGRMAYIVNGYGGVFKGMFLALRDQIYEELKSSGYTFGSLTKDCIGTNNQLPDGMYMHPTEMKCIYVSKLINDGKTPMEALASCSMQLPSEFLTFMLSLDDPGCIIWSRINYPMFAGFADHGTYLATTPQAMPDDAKNITLLNALSYGRIYADRIETYPFLETDITIAPITPSVWKACYEAMEEALRKDKMHHDNLDRLIRNLFAPATCPPESAVDYAIMDQWEREGRLSISKEFRKGSAPGLVAPKVYFKLK